MITNQSVSSPIATGGSGTFFEQHVGAHFLALLLVGGIPPILKDCQVQEVHFQTEHLGWHTDDLLIIGTRGVGGQRKLATQVKRKFTVSQNSDESKKAFCDFWKDFKHNQKFNFEIDRLALVTLRGTDTLLNSFNSLLDCSRASTDGADFARRLETTGLLSKTAQNQAASIRAIIEEAEGAVPSENDFWSFLRVLHVVSFDLNTATAQNEAWIKSLLAQATHEPDPMTTAEATWLELLEIAGTAMPSAASFTHDALPERLRNRHSVVSGKERGALQLLADHSETTLDGIHMTIANAATIPRDELMLRLVDALDESQVVVVAGPAGSGKSALAKSVVEHLRDDYFCLAFRAEEFSKGHIDQTLQQAQTAINAQQLLALLAGQGRKIILVESVERLLEASVRDAFSDLLGLARQDRSIQLILTCRDYSVDTVQASLLDQASLQYLTLEVPKLTDDELAQVAQTIQGLARAIESERLKELLRTPYLLDKAAQMDWSDVETFPRNEKAFRARCWREVVRCEEKAAGGLPARREQVFLNLALRRARELRPYVSCEGLDPEALEALCKDSLIAMSPETNALATPAHDVLEDWAILHWLGSRFSLSEEDAASLAEDIGGYPAIRRGYRKWLGEMLEQEAERSSAFVMSTFLNRALPAYFRDDTLVCTLLSSSANEFLALHVEELFAEEDFPLARVIHLLRVACKTAPIWLAGAPALPSQLLVPKGDAWAAVLKIISERVNALLPAQLGLLLGLVEDWARSVAWYNPEPQGFHDAGKIVFAILPYLDGYRMNTQRKRALEILAKIPHSEEAAFRELLERGCAMARHDHTASDLAEILLSGMSSFFASRRFPEEMGKLAKARLCLSDEDLKKARRYHSPVDIDCYFGIRKHLRHDFFPSSAIRGIFHPLLKCHPNIGVRFIIDLLNYSCTWYGEQRWPYDRLEEAWQLTITTPEGEQITQWANPRLWGLYRGMSVGPYVLQTALMALEKWLLDICESEKVDVEPWLLYLLQKSNNVAITAVVASVCNAHPEKAGRAALPLLTSQDLIYMDRARMVQESGHSGMSGIFPSINAESKIYEDERKTSDSLPHRKHDLEALAVKLQIGGQNEEVWRILDNHREALPPKEDQSEEDCLWRLALHRMDVRAFRTFESESGAETNDQKPDEEPEKERLVYFGPGEIEEDVQELIDRHVPVRARQESDLALLNWGLGVLRQSDRVDVSAWQTKLAEAKERVQEPRESDDFCAGGPGFIAAVCVRDHWEEIDPDDREWCVAKLINAVKRYSDSDDSSIRYGRGGYRPDRAAAFVLPRVLSESAPENTDPRVVEAIAIALTHSVSEVVSYAAEGIGYYLQGHGELSDFTLRFVGAVARQARLIEELQAIEDSKPFDERMQRCELIRRVVPEVRACVLAGEVDGEREVSDLSLDEWPGQQAAQNILQILRNCPDSQLARQFYSRLGSALVKEWDADLQERGLGNRRNFEFEHECLQRVSQFALKLPTTDALTLCDPLLVAVAEHPRDTTWFVRSLIVEVDSSEGKTPFWELWQAFADRICVAPWIQHLDSRHPTGQDLLNIIFLGVEWKEEIRHWRLLVGQGGRVDALVERLPPLSPVIEAYCRFLYSIGEHSLPNGFIIVARRLSAGTPIDILANSNVHFFLESLLRRYVYGEPLRLKSNRSVRESVLQILDQLVEAGSSAAYRMRDDFVTPVAVQAI